MEWRPIFRLRDWLLPAGTLAVGAGVLLFALRGEPVDVQPPDCSLNPVAYHPGTFLTWKLALERVSGGGELSARVRLDDGREVIAYNATNSELRPNDRVTVSEIVCIHRTVHLLTEFGAPPRETAMEQPEQR